LNLIADVLFNTVFYGLAVWAAVVLLAAILPSSFGLKSYFMVIASPARKGVALLTPAAVPSWMHVILTVFWLLALRVLFYLLMASNGLLPLVS
jgi:hypothetical protein